MVKGEQREGFKLGAGGEEAGGGVTVRGGGVGGVGLRVLPGSTSCQLLAWLPLPGDRP